MFFKKKVLSEIFIKKLTLLHSELLGVAREINNKSKEHEVGIFIASIATLKILTLEVEDPRKLADEFITKWINYLVTQEKGLDAQQALTRLQQVFPIYREIFLGVIDPKASIEAKNTMSTELARQLMVNCGSSDSGMFLKIMMYSPQITLIGVTTFKEIQV
jgi:hypothetical protein